MLVASNFAAALKSFGNLSHSAQNRLLSLRDGKQFVQAVGQEVANSAPQVDGGVSGFVQKLDEHVFAPPDMGGMN